MRGDLSETALEPRQPDELEAVQLAIEENPAIVLPHTGEVIDGRDTQAVAQASLELKELEDIYYKLRQSLKLLLVLEGLRQGSKTLHLDGLDVVISGGEETVYDEELLYEGLEAAGLPPDRLNEAVTRTVTYKVQQRVVKYLEVNPVYAAVISRARSYKPKAWDARVKRKGRTLANRD